MAVLACVFPSDAQITAALNRRSDGLEEVRIRNDAASALTAFAVTVQRAARVGNAPLVTFSDPLIEPEVRPLPAGEERVVIGFQEPGRVRGPVAGRRGVLLEPVVSAGVFADGSTTGDAALLARLIVRRGNMLLAVETTLETLAGAGRRNVPRDQLIAEFKKLADSVSRWYLPPEQQVGRRLYHSIVGKLVNLPDGPTGSPFPPSDFVARETAALLRHRVRLLESQPSLAGAAGVAR
jgi:hypothetical protein